MTVEIEAKPAAETPNTPFYRLGGAPVFEAICNRFYDLMEQDPAYAELRAIHAEDLTPMRESLPKFLAGWAGGPRDWFEANPGRCMMSIHKPFTISKALGAQWAEAMQRAIADVDPQPADMAKAMGDVLADLANGMGKS
ncbi:group II truncated hemoglobin [Novosphingobium mangrovi (ex Huang et al. 2023)]|uniref:Group II truncated hemoglobin n=1 Tax=Novosphingobium mangrovi (ex Huang et al. 2023) TaxID=2976432 RepID=A0ABT2I9T4_9SPHN|nr:group II truncated hemoglobin [Novosphingobium mangrovi (ex Huang et al. 2023)]MCT2401323.1 group II truncated hemoglobin [Novosphingobium mangrovi (ex Huang et al. 2023)]